MDEEGPSPYVPRNFLLNTSGDSSFARATIQHVNRSQPQGQYPVLACQDPQKKPCSSFDHNAGRYAPTSDLSCHDGCS